MPKKQPRILIVCWGGNMARLHLHSGVVNHLADLGGEVIVVIPMGESSPLRGLADRRVKFSDANFPRQWLENRGFQRVYQYLFHTILPTETNRIKEEAMRQHEPFRYRCVRAVKSRRGRAVLGLWNGLRRLAFPGRLFMPFFRQVDPDLVVVGSMGRALQTYYALRCARQLQVRSLVTTQSWDFLSMKDYPLERPDRLIAWNEPHARDAVRLHGFAREHVYVSGVPHFDVHFTPREFPDRETWFAAHGLDPRRRLITVTPQPSLFRPRILDEVVETLARAMKQGGLARECQVLIRPHPVVYAGEVPGQGTEADLRRYEAMDPGIHGNRPRMAGARINFDIHPQEHSGVAHLLHHSDVVLDFFGTISLEACAVGTPVVYVDFPPVPGSKQDRSKKMDFRNFEHIQSIVALQGARVADQPEQLIAMINQYLLDRTLDQDRRRQVVERLCHKSDGHSARRMAIGIHEYACGHWPVPETVEPGVAGAVGHAAEAVSHA